MIYVNFRILPSKLSLIFSLTNYATFTLEKSISSIILISGLDNLDDFKYLSITFLILSSNSTHVYLFNIYFNIYYIYYYKKINYIFKKIYVVGHSNWAG